MQWAPLEWLRELPGWLTVSILVFLGFLVLRFLIHVFVTWFVYRAGKAVPAEHREIEPALAFLLLVPCLEILLNFLVQPCIARSYRRWFEARGDESEGDCGENLAWWYAILGVCVCVPCVDWVAGPAAIVLQVLYLLRLARLRRKALGAARS